MAVLLAFEAALHLENMGYSKEKANEFVSERLSIDLEEFKEEYTKAFKEADFIPAYHYNKHYLNMDDETIHQEMNEKREKRKKI
ncbi:hypothetical protein phiOC_p395 [Ochrobactrum phage vB_OspM_OC]|nr:hypothetical protein phiOC_p395 [Ochrobactrum phage vB_OspM_OC]